MAVLHVGIVAIYLCFHLVSSDHLQKEHWLFVARGSQTHVYGAKVVVYGLLLEGCKFFCEACFLFKFVHSGCL